jgi:hypothetical protein
MSEKIGYLYINGLGDGATTLKDRVVKWWWQRKGLDIQHAHINWYDGKSLEEKLATVEQKVDEMLSNFGGVAIIGSSAGGSLAINSFYRLRDKNVCAVSTHGRLKAGDYPDSHRMSLYHRAHLDTDKPSQSFFDSVTMAETQAIPELSKQDKERLLILTQLTDMVVPMETMGIEGVQLHRSIAFGHSGGFIAHLLADWDLIAGFANRVL